MPKDRHSANTHYHTVMPEGEKIGELPVVIGGDNLPSPGWNRAN